MNLEFRNIAHVYGDFQALSDINLTVPLGEITCLLGSSGCGKTTLLNLAAGLLPLQQGKILLDGEVMADASANPPPEKRPVGLVFQDGALFPHLNIAENICFGIKDKASHKQVADKWLDQIGLKGLNKRFPSNLSGGQQQRVALARAMATDPAVLLMDEPFASIDIVLRRELRREVRKLLKARNATTILVTHDPEEAMEIGDQIAVMERGKINQAGSPEQLYHAPASLTVGAMFGDAQVLSGRKTGEGVETPFGLWPLSCLNGSAPAGELDLLVRCDALDIQACEQGFAISDIRHMGAVHRISMVNQDGEELTVHSPHIEQDYSCKQLTVKPKAASIFAFPKSAA